MNKKVLLLGSSGCGKTSMRSIIFANYIAQDTKRLGATVNVENSHVKFLGNLNMNIWDCGGQDFFLEKYFGTQREYIFKNVEVLIFVVDIYSKKENEDLHIFKETMKTLSIFSPNAKIFCLIHKMDLIAPESKQQVFQEKENKLKLRSAPFNIVTFQTSIWDETLYKAWSAIVYSLIPNAEELELRLNKFCHIAEADEVVLFEKATFLVISHSGSQVDPSKPQDPHRFEKISNIIKQFKLSCSKTSALFNSMQVRNSNYCAMINQFTNNTYIMVVTYDPTNSPATTAINIDLAKKYFEPLLSN
uniref:GTP-binding protein n=1 Tax=Arcella intermedia TaxID=1963864 RepID=A0A6B2LBX3_9EUKA